MLIHLEHITEFAFYPVIMHFFHFPKKFFDLPLHKLTPPIQWQNKPPSKIKIFWPQQIFSKIFDAPIL